MTASDTLPHPTITSAHEHGWVTESAHRTSEGEVLYVRCDTCGSRRVDLRGAHAIPPSAQTRALSAARR